MNSIRIIIPVYNEAETLLSFYNHIQSRIHDPENTSITFVDGGSTDDTVRLIHQTDALLLQSPKKGRANQMNYGAQHSHEDVFYFLHCDSIPPNHFDKKIRSTVLNNYQSGCFRMKFDSNHPILSISGWFTRLPWKICRGGDQSLFITKSLFEKIGGYDSELTVFEDIEIIERIKQETRFKVIQETLTTSARRYRDNGIFRLQSLFAILHLMYTFGYSQERIIKFYKKHVR